MLDLSDKDLTKDSLSVRDNDGLFRVFAIVGLLVNRLEIESSCCTVCGNTFSCNETWKREYAYVPETPGNIATLAGPV